MAKRRLSDAEIANLADRFGGRVANNSNGKPRDILDIPESLRGALAKEAELLQNTPLPGEPEPEWLAVQRRLFPTAGQHRATVASSEEAAPSGWDSVRTTAKRIVPAVAGGIIGGVSGGPPGAVGGLVAGTAIGETWAQRDEQRNSGEAFVPDRTRLAIAAGSAALPWGAIARPAGAVARTVAPRVTANAARFFNPASPAARTLAESIRHETPRLMARGAAQGAPINVIEGQASRTFQHQPTTIGDIGRDATLGALVGAGVPLAGNIVQSPLRAMAPDTGRGVPEWLRRRDTRTTAAQQRQDVNRQISGSDPRQSTSSFLAEGGYTGTLQEQQLAVKLDIDEANRRIREAVSQDATLDIPISDAKNLSDELEKIANHYGAQNSQGDEIFANKARALSKSLIAEGAPPGTYLERVSPDTALDIRQFLDAQRTQGSYSPEFSVNASPQATLRNLSDGVRRDISEGIPAIADTLAFSHNANRAYEDILQSGASSRNASGDFINWRSVGGAGVGVAVSPGAAAAAAGTMAANRSARFRSGLGRRINELAGNRFAEIPVIGDMPLIRPDQPQITSGARPMPASPDPSGAIPQNREYWADPYSTDLRGVPGQRLLADVGQQGHARRVAPPPDPSGGVAQGDPSLGMARDASGNWVVQQIPPSARTSAAESVELGGRTPADPTPIPPSRFPATDVFRREVGHQTQRTGGAERTPFSVGPQRARAGASEAIPDPLPEHYRQMETDLTRVLTSRFDQVETLKAIREAFPRTDIISVGAGSPAPMKVELPDGEFITVRTQAAADKFRKFLDDYLTK